MQIKGVIFDMDGLILDTEKLYNRFWREASEICGYPMSMDQALTLRSLDKQLAKKKLREFFGDDYDYQRVHDVRVRLMAEYVEENGVQCKPGVLELTDYLKKNGYKTAVATATNIERASQHLTLAGVRDCFENIVCASSVNRGKPFPDIYLYACEKIGLPPENCAALEDSPNGIKSAYSAGCIPIMIPDMDTPSEDIRALAYDVADSLINVIEILGKH